MSSNLIFRVPGRTQNYMPLDVNTPKGDIMEKYARSSFSTTNQWPAESPYAGYYDIKNSDTKLILLNNQQKTSHLRGKAQSNKQTISKKDQYYEYVEKEYEKKKNSSAENSLCWGSSTSRPKMDPDRHYNSGQHSYRYLQEDLNGPSAEYKYLRQKTKSAVPFPKAQSTKSFKTTLDKKEEEQLENDILLKYLYAVGKRTTGLQNTNLNRRPPREFLSSYNLNHPEFNKGQRLFLNELCSMYSVEPLKQLKQDQYLNLFKKQTVGDSKHRLKYRMHDGDNFELYKRWLSYERPLPHEVNCGYAAKGTLKSKSMINKPVSTSSLSNSSTMINPQSSSQPGSPQRSQRQIVRPTTAKKPKIDAKLTSSSDNSFNSTNKKSDRIESQDMINKIKQIENDQPIQQNTESSDEMSQ